VRISGHQLDFVVHHFAIISISSDEAIRIIPAYSLCELFDCGDPNGAKVYSLFVVMWTKISAVREYDMMCCDVIGASACNLST